MPGKCNESLGSIARMASEKPDMIGWWLIKIALTYQACVKAARLRYVDRRTPHYVGYIRCKVDTFDQHS